MANGLSFKVLETNGREITELSDLDVLFVGKASTLETDGSPQMNFVKVSNLNSFSAEIASLLYLHNNCV